MSAGCRGRLGRGSGWRHLRGGAPWRALTALALLAMLLPVACRDAPEAGVVTTLQTNASTLDSRMTTNEGDITALETGVADLEDRQSNPLQVALLRWYEASEAGNDFAVGNSPHFAAFDGAHIWVTNHLSNTVTKLRAADGATLGNFPTGDHPLGLALRWGPHLGGESA